MNTRDRVSQIVVEHLGVEPEKVVDDADFINQLGADSLDMVELTMAFEEDFNIHIEDAEAERVNTFGDAVRLIEEKVN